MKLVPRKIAVRLAMDCGNLTADKLSDTRLTKILKNIDKTHNGKGLKGISKKAYTTLLQYKNNGVDFKVRDKSEVAVTKRETAAKDVEAAQKRKVEKKKAVKEKKKTEAKEPKEKKKTEAKEPKEKTETKKKNPGVITAIVEGLTKSWLSRKELFEMLVKTFPDRKAAGMKHTIYCQVPSRLDKKYEIKVNKQGQYKITKAKK